jgi:hypothetical protein
MNIEEMLKEMDTTIEDDNTEKFYRYSGIILESLRKRIGDGLLAAIAEAGPERVKILPCNVGDSVYRVFNGKIEKLLVETAVYESLIHRWKIFTIPHMCIYWEDNFGKTVFLTQESAEAALEGDK